MIEFNTYHKYSIVKVNMKLEKENIEYFHMI